MVTSELHEEGSGGGGIYVYQLCKELIRQGHEVDVIASLKSRSKLRTPFKIFKINLSKLPILGMIKWGIEAYVCSIKLMQTTKYDVINVHCPLSSSIYPFVYASRIPMVITIHTGWSLTNPRYPLHQKMFSLIRDLVSCIKSRKIIVLNKSYGQELRRWSIYQEKIVYIPNAVDWQRFAIKRNGKETFREKFRIPREAIVLFYMGRIAKYKGVESLLDAIRILQKTTREHIWVIIAGDGPLRSSLMKKYCNLQNVLFTGSLWKSEKTSAYQESDLFVIPSVRGEGMPTVLLEAMAAGLPIISTRIPGTVEVIRKEFGMLVNPSDPMELARAILDMIADASSLRKMGQKAKLWSRQFDWAIIGEQIAELFRSCLKDETPES